MKSTVHSVLTACDAEPEGERFSPTRYPYTYACDFLRQHPEVVPREAIVAANRRLIETNNDGLGGMSSWSRSEASCIRGEWAAIEHRPDDELAHVLADAYLIREGITRPVDA